VAALLEDGVPYSDVELACTTASGVLVPGSSCRAHRFLLAARCPLLTELLRSNGSCGGIEGVVTGVALPEDGGLQLQFPNIKVQTVKALLTYLYADVLRAPAHRYVIPLPLFKLACARLAGDCVRCVAVVQGDGAAWIGSSAAFTTTGLAVRSVHVPCHGCFSWRPSHLHVCCEHVVIAGHHHVRRCKNYGEAPTH
jgi:hypothetical protein